MRIYLPARVSDLDSPVVSAASAFAVNPALRGAAPDEDEEGLEYLAFLAAADAAIDAGEVSRIVLAADAPGRDTGQAGIVTVVDVPWEDVVSIHIDDLTDADLLADLGAAQAGDGDARDRVNDADLLWYDVSERADVLIALAAL